MKLICSLTSPFARKVRIVLAEKQIDYQLLEDSPWVEGNTISQHNPLGKIPVLLLEDGSTLFDSRVIVEYLDTVNPINHLIPASGRSKVLVKRFEALADGICDAAVAAFLERKRPENQQSAEWIERQLLKIHLGIAELARNLGDRTWCVETTYSLADIASICALGYLDLRHSTLNWREAHPNLHKFFDRTATKTSFMTTMPPLS